MADPRVLPPEARVFRYDNITSAQTYTGGSDPFKLNGKTFLPPVGRGWSTKPEGLSRLAHAGRLHGIGNTLSYVRYLNDFPVTRISNIWNDTVISGFGTSKTYVVETLPEVVKRALLMTTDPGDLVLDPTCGSGTTAFVAEQWGRRWITTDTSRVALTLARTRLMAARFPYYIPSDSPEGRKLEAEFARSGPAGAPFTSVGAAPTEVKAGSTARDAGSAGRGAGSPPVAAAQSAVGTPSTGVHAAPGEGPDIRRGFIYKRVPHVTLKSIANNPDIKEGMSRREIDAAIARHADTELLYDKPYEDTKIIRVCGPFTVESLSPHRTLSLQARRERSARGTRESEGVVTGMVSQRVIGPDDFGRMVLDNLKRAGVQNTFKGEKMVFEALDPHPGEWIQGAGAYTDKAGKSQRVGVCIGPEHGTVGPELVKEAAKEAVRGVGFDTLLIAGFAFDPHVGEEARRYGKLTVLPVRINADIAMGELLKKTGAGNLFMIFGEPDVKIDKHKDGQISVTIHGLDVYDPTTGEVRSSSTDDIACWFIDTAYNGEAFFVRHAYFTGAGEPYDKLKRALRAEVDESAWSTLYSATSRPFSKPSTGRIAVKVINHFGDEVLKVYDVK